jgi:hypothetical protein
VTPSGRILFHDEVLHRLSTPQPNTADFDLALSCLPVLNENEIRVSMESVQTRLTMKIHEIEEKILSFQNKMEPHVNDFFDHSLKAMKSELEWISNYLFIMEKK